MMNRKLRATLCAGALSLILAGCGDWKQNPLDGKEGNFGDGKPVPTKPDLAKPLPSDAVKITLPDFQSFEEGVRSEFPITARILRAGYTAVLEIDNIADFPGATFNKATGIFAWTPAIGYLESIGERNERGQKVLKVHAYGYKTGDQVLVGEEARPVYISREFKVPQVLSITKRQQFVREGTTLEVEVVILDKDAIAADRNTWPKILPQPINGMKSLAGLTTISRDESLGGGQYRTFMLLDLRDSEVTDAIDAFGANLVAASRFGKVSPPSPLSVDVYTSFATPTSTWTAALQSKATQPINYTFLVTDPKMETYLSLDRTFNLPAGSNLTCAQVGRGLLNCTFTWTPGEFAVGTYEIQAYIKSRNFDSRDTLLQTKTLYFRTQVLPKGI